MTSDQPPAPTLLICSVGGTPEPLVQTLLHWRPAAVRFVVSDQTRPQVDAVLRAYEELAREPLSPGCYELVAVDDPEDLVKVVACLRPLGAHVRNWIDRGSDYRVVADFTGGTKCMSAALALVARRWPCQFSYIGGERRSKDGVGVVESGSERVVLSANPWDALGYQAVEDAVTVFNHGGYAAAAALLDHAVKNVERPEVKRELSTLKAVIDAYTEWDRFDHTTARQRFDDAIKNRNDLAAIFADAQELIRHIESHKANVATLADQTEPTTAWVEDLLRNAERRAAEHRYDDAVARLYRAFEALAQVRLREQHGLSDTKAVPLDRLPHRLHKAWGGRARDGQLFLGLRDAYRLLQELGDDLGARFAEAGLNQDESSPLVARNHSILAHGFQPASQAMYTPLHDRLCQLAPFEPGDGDDWCLPAPR